MLRYVVLDGYYLVFAIVINTYCFESKFWGEGMKLCRNLVGLILILLVFSLMFSMVVPDAGAQSSGRFPDEGTFNGMAIIYSVSGVDLTVPVDTSDFTTSRVFNGSVSGSVVSVSGTFHFERGSPTFVIATASVSVGGTDQSFTYDCSTNESISVVDQPFSASVTVPSGATSGSFSITMTATYGNGEVRGLTVSGRLTASGGGVGGDFEVDYITLFSDGPTDYVYAGSSSFTLRATVFGKNQVRVPDGTLVSFGLSDRFGGLAGASVYPVSAGTVDSEVVVTFTPPRSSYWNDPDHDPTANNRITITASAGGKQASYVIYILPDDYVDWTATPVPTQPSQPGFKLCIIATATFGSPLAPEVVFMRSVRDDLIGSSAVGRVLVDGWNAFYYSWSTPVAVSVAGSDGLKGVFKVVLAPLLGSMYVVAGVYSGWVWLSPDVAAVVAFLTAAVLAVGIYVVLPLFALRFVWRFLRGRFGRGKVV